MLNGACLCGRIQYEIDGEPRFMYQCFCGKCRAASGASFVTNIIVDTDRFRITAGKESLTHSNQAQRNAAIFVLRAARRSTATVKRQNRWSRFAVARYCKIQVCASPTMPSLLRGRLGSTSAAASVNFPNGPIQRWLGSFSQKAMTPEIQNIKVGFEKFFSNKKASVNTL